MLSIQLVLATIQTAERLGVERTRFLQMAQFDAARIAATEGRMSPAEFSRLCELNLDLSDDPALGLHEGEALPATTFNIVGHLVGHAATLRKAFETLFQIYRLLSDQPRYQLNEHEQHATLCCAGMEGVSARVRRFMAEVEVVGFSQMIGHFGAGARPEQVCLDYAAPAHRHEYARIFAGTERFEQPFTGIVFDRALLDVPSIFKDDEMYSALREQAEHRLARIARRASYAERAHDVLAKGASDRTGMEAVARALGLSVRSLRRRLAAEGTSYQALANDAFASVAKRHLLLERRTIQETAFAMGYADSGAFHRAFKRWTGMTPSAFLAAREG